MISSESIDVVAKPTKLGEATHLRLYLSGFMDCYACNDVIVYQPYP